MTILKTILSSLFLLSFSLSYSQSDTANTQNYFSKKIMVTAGKDYGRGGFTEFFLGKHWRDLWITPFEVGVLDLKKFAGGLTPYKRGGGLQTNSLRLKGENGKIYKFRSVDKDPRKLLAPELQNTFVADAFKDQISTSNPLAALIVAPMMNEIGILNAEPIVVLMPDDNSLGKYRKTFANLLGTLEENPEDGLNGEKGFGGADKIVNTFNLYKKLEKDNDVQIDYAEFLKARLFDLMVGDWDRHSDQWLWAGYKKDGKTIYKPIPRDRDQAFCLYDGLLPMVVSKSITQIEGYGKDYPKIYDLTFNGRYIDKRFLPPVEKKIYDSLTVYIQQKITDEVIKKAVMKMPLEWYKLEGYRLIGMIKSRRDKLKKASDEYYELINETADIYGSKKNEYVEINNLNDEELEVKIYKLDNEKGGKKGEPYFTRIFDSDYTKEIRLYLNSGNDVVNQNRNNESGIDIIIIGDENKIKFTGSSKDDFDIYQEFRSKSDEVARYEPQFEDSGYDWRLGPVLNYNTDDGLILGAGPILYKHGFRADPYIYRMTFLGSYAFNAMSYNLEYTGDFLTLIKGIRIGVEVQKTEQAITRYFGEGNETTLNKTLETDGFYKVGQELLFLAASFEFSLTKKFSFIINPYYKFSDVSYDENTLLGQNPSTYGIGAIKFAGIRSNLIFDTRDNESEPFKGIYAQMAGNFTPNLFSTNSEYGKAGLDFRAYISTDSIKGATFVFRAAGGKAWGNYPFFESIFLGGLNSLKGFSRERFAGDAALMGQTEIRLRIASVRILIPGIFGISVFGGAGRVFLSGENSHRWHNSFGGSVWMTYLNRSFNTGITVAQSDEGVNFFFGSAIFL